MVGVIHWAYLSVHARPHCPSFSFNVRLNGFRIERSVDLHEALSSNWVACQTVADADAADRAWRNHDHDVTRRSRAVRVRTQRVTWYVHPGITAARIRRIGWLVAAEGVLSHRTSMHAFCRADRPVQELTVLQSPFTLCSQLYNRLHHRFYMFYPVIISG